MIVTTIISVAVAAFLTGFLLGTINIPPKSSVKVYKNEPPSAEEILSEEYRNFLSYDGSEQI